MSRLSYKHPAVMAAQAHTDLNVFAAVVVLLESSLQSADCRTAAAKIIALAKAEQQRCLRRYDEALAECVPAKVTAP